MVVAHPEKSVTDVRCTDARRRERDDPEGVTQTFQVVLYKVDPRLCVFACNLLSKDFWRSALLDEPVEVWPQVPLVSKPRSFACLAERLARTGTGPHGSVVWASGLAKRVTPHSDASEEVTLREASQIRGANVFNRSLVNFPRSNVAFRNEVSKPLGCIWIDLVVVGAHGADTPSKGPLVLGGNPHPRVSLARRRADSALMENTPDPFEAFLSAMHRQAGEIAAIKTVVLVLISCHPEPQKLRALFAKARERAEVADLFSALPDDALQAAQRTFDRLAGASGSAPTGQQPPPRA